MATRIEKSIAEGVAFLSHSQSQRGWWRDFQTLAGTSDEWTTAYIGMVLAGIPLPNAREAAEKAAQAIKRRGRIKKGWSYNVKVPVDTDSTAWGLHLYRRLFPEKPQKGSKARKFLHGSLSPDGGLPTYRSEGPIRLFTRLDSNISFEGWCHNHICVTASAAPLFPEADQERIVEYLLAEQGEEGGWEAYWWKVPEYATYFALKFLLEKKNARLPDAIEKARHWIELRAQTYLKRNRLPHRRPTANSFRAAFLVLALGLCQPKPFVKEMQAALLDLLLELQLESGGWAPAAGLRIPPPSTVRPSDFIHWVKEGRGGGSVNSDHNGLFTTATILEALQHAPFE